MKIHIRKANRALTMHTETQSSVNPCILSLKKFLPNVAGTTFVLEGLPDWLTRLHFFCRFNYVGRRLVGKDTHQKGNKGVAGTTFGLEFAGFG